MARIPRGIVGDREPAKRAHNAVVKVAISAEAEAKDAADPAALREVRANVGAQLLTTQPAPEVAKGLGHSALTTCDPSHTTRVDMSDIATFDGFFVHR